VTEVQRILKDAGYKNVRCW